MEKRKGRRKGKEEGRLIYKGSYKQINSSYLWMVGLWMVSIVLLSLSSDFHTAYGLFLQCENRESISKKPHDKPTYLAPPLSALPSLWKVFFSATSWRSRGIPCKCSRASSASAGLSGAEQPGGKHSSSGVLVLEQDTSQKDHGKKSMAAVLAPALPAVVQHCGMQRFLSASRCLQHFISSVPKGHLQQHVPTRKMHQTKVGQPRSPSLCSWGRPCAGVPRMSGIPELTRIPT